MTNYEFMICHFISHSEIIVYVCTCMYMYWRHIDIGLDGRLTLDLKKVVWLTSTAAPAPYFEKLEKSKKVFTVQKYTAPNFQSSNFFFSP